MRVKKYKSIWLVKKEWLAKGVYDTGRYEIIVNGQIKRSYGSGYIWSYGGWFKLYHGHQIQIPFDICTFSNHQRTGISYRPMTMGVW